jgi:hypothetical protein
MSPAAAPPWAALGLIRSSFQTWIARSVSARTTDTGTVVGVVGQGVGLPRPGVDSPLVTIPQDRLRSCKLVPWASGTVRPASRTGT